MPPSLPLLLVPGLLCSARLYGPQIAALWQEGPIMVADHRRHERIQQVAQDILQVAAPPRFALAGLSYGGYVAFEMMRQAPERIARLALLDTSARADTPEQTQAREKFIAMAQVGKLDDVVATLAPRFVHKNRPNDAALTAIIRAMAQETGAEAFI